MANCFINYLFLMKEKFQNKYRIKSIRAQWWNYEWSGAYFITICTKNMEHFFGKIINGKIKLFQLGIIVNILWYKIPNHAPFVELGDFVVMPNHIHGILILNKPNLQKTLHAVETLHATSLQKNEKMAEISPKPNSISTIIRSYKSAVTKHANRLNLKNGWQPRFYDHVIRDDDEYQRISDYIISNPDNWKDDKFNSEYSKINI